MATISKRLLSLAALLVIMTVPVACVTTAQVKNAPDQETLESRVLERWNAVIEQDFKKTYEYFSPAYRKLFSYDYYISRTGSSISWISANIENVEITDKRAKVDVAVRYELFLPMGAGDNFGKITKTVEEMWIWNNGNWWYIVKNEKDTF